MATQRWTMGGGGAASDGPISSTDDDRSWYGEDVVSEGAWRLSVTVANFVTGP